MWRSSRSCPIPDGARLRAGIKAGVLLADSAVWLSVVLGLLTCLSFERVRKMASKRFWWGLGAVALVLALIVASTFNLLGGPRDDGKPARLAINPWPGYELLYLAEQKGFFKEEGLNVVLKQFSSLEDVRNAFENGTVDGICSTLVEMIQAKANKGKLAQVALVADFSSGADEIQALREVADVKALKGREGIRLRVGDWRVIMDDQGNVLAILDIGPRGGVYD